MPRSTLFLPEVLRTGDHPPEFAKPTELDERPGYTGGGDDWPGHWEIIRDEVAHTARVLWKQDTWAGYPWGRTDDHEDMTYDASDDHPETSWVRGYAFTKVKLKTRELNFESHLELRSDAKIVGITAGASAPEVLVEDVIDALRRLGPVDVSELTGRQETIEFRLPPELTDGSNVGRRATAKV
jgi:hypothetical protein